MNQPATVAPTHKRWHTYSPALNVHSPVHMTTWSGQQIQSTWLNTGTIWYEFPSIDRKKKKKIVWSGTQRGAIKIELKKIYYKTECRLCLYKCFFYQIRVLHQWRNLTAIYSLDTSVNKMRIFINNTSIPVWAPCLNPQPLRYIFKLVRLRHDGLG